MSADDADDLLLDLTGYSEPANLDVAWALVLADARQEKSDDRVEVDEDVERESAVANETDDEAQDPDLSTMNEYQREAWAAEEGLGREEERRRLGLVIAWDRDHGSVRPTHVAGRSGWGDVPLDGILDGIAAGTLALPKPTVGMLADGSAGLFYPGRVNGIAGESGAGKGWIALTVAVEQMGLGRHGYYIDYEDSPALAMIRLVQVLGVDPLVVRQYFHYLHPARHDQDGIAELVERVTFTPDAFVVIDSTGESIAAAGWNQNHDENVAAWFQSLAHPLADQGGATVLLLDHMVKSEDGGLWPIGSQRKRAAITGAQYVAEVADPFSKGKDGMVVLRVAKDRHGAREARAVATYIQFQHPIESMTTMPDGTTEIVQSEALTVVLGAGKSANQIKADRDAKAAAELDTDVSELNRLAPPPKSQRDVMERMHWGAGRAMTALREWRVGPPGSMS